MVAGRGGDSGPQVLGELDDGRAYSAGATMNQDRLARLEAADRYKRLPRGERDDRQSSCLSQRDASGRGGEGVGVDHDIVGPGSHSHHTGVAVDPITDGERCDLRADGDHLAAQLSPHDLRQVQAEDGLELTGTGALVRMVDTGRDHPH